MAAGMISCGVLLAFILGAAAAAGQPADEGSAWTSSAPKAQQRHIRRAILQTGGDAGCASIKAAKAAARQPAPSDYYTATFFGSATRVYCDMSKTPKTYLVLPSAAGQGANTSTFGDLAATTYSAVRLNFAAGGAISLDTSDTRFAQTSIRSFDVKKDGSVVKYTAALAAGYLKGYIPAAFGSAAACSPALGGKGVVDLRGTPFSMALAAYGGSAAAAFSFGNQVVVLTVAGTSCGSVKIAGSIAVLGQYRRCNDGIQNGDETGIDCGGSCPTACPATCTDGVRNGAETGVDCGGDICAACPTCTDGIVNGDETGVDCGGSCPEVCRPATCNDGIRNGDETSRDCGGSCKACPTCCDGIRNGNELDIDCGGPSCPDACQPPRCDDGRMNGAETDVDCGGPDCAACADYKLCDANADCASGTCDVRGNRRSLCHPACPVDGCGCLFGPDDRSRPGTDPYTDADGAEVPCVNEDDCPINAFCANGGCVALCPNPNLPELPFLPALRSRVCSGV